MVSTSFVAVLPPADREAMVATVLSLLDRDPRTAGRDVVRLPYRTDVYVTTAVS